MKRWRASDKLAVVEAVRGGAVTREGALAFYEISPEEYAEWEDGYDKFGKEGLKTTKLQLRRRG